MQPAKFRTVGSTQPSPLVTGVTLPFLALAALAALFLTGPSPALADPVTYLNVLDTPEKPAHVLYFAVPEDSGDYPLFLYVNGGTDPGVNNTPCRTGGDGEHLCAYQIEIEATGEISFNSFTDSSGSTFELTDDFRHLSIIATNLATPPLGPQRIGEIRVETSGGTGYLRLVGGGLVIGKPGWQDWEATDMLTNNPAPEPGFGSALAIAVAFLSCFRRVPNPAKRRLTAQSNEGFVPTSEAATDWTTRQRSFASLLLLTLGFFGLGLGVAEPAEAADPTIVIDGRWTEMTAGREHSCGIIESGEIICFGDDTFDQISKAPSGTFRRLSAGEDTTCAIDLRGFISCWGGIPGPLLSPPVGPDFISVSVGSFNACAVQSDRSVECWGLPQFPLPPTGPAVTEVANGLEHSCARRPNGTLICWGLAPAGATNIPPGLASQPYIYVGTGDSHTCALRGDGTVDCWGDPAFGKADRPATLFESLSVGHEHNCGVRFDGVIECWGRNDAGEAPASFGSDFVSVHAGEDHTCGIKSDQSAVCFGDPGTKSTPPQTRTLGIAAGAAHTCSLGFNGSAECWGANSSGQLAAPTIELVAIDAGRRHNCALDTNERAHCWGDDSQGQSPAPDNFQFTFERIAAGGNASCAIRTFPANATRPIECWGQPLYEQDQPPAGDFNEVALGNRHGCGIRTDGTLACWGDPLSLNGKTDPPSGIFTEVTAGNEHSCALTDRGLAICWGDNTFGQRTPPSSVFTRIAAGERHTCGLLLSGRIACWGDPSDGRIDSPPGRFEAISTYDNHTCAIREGGGVACWGLGGAAGEAIPIDDSDLDGLGDGVDNCPFIANPDQSDGDEDGAGDVCDVCPTFPDPEQLASYGDGVGDRCDESPRIEITPNALNVAPLKPSMTCTSTAAPQRSPRSHPKCRFPYSTSQCQHRWPPSETSRAAIRLAPGSRASAQPSTRSRRPPNSKRPVSAVDKPS